MPELATLTPITTPHCKLGPLRLILKDELTVTAVLLGAFTTGRLIVGLGKMSRLAGHRGDCHASTRYGPEHQLLHGHLHIDGAINSLAAAFLKHRGISQHCCDLFLELGQYAHVTSRHAVTKCGKQVANPQ